MTSSEDSYLSVGQKPVFYEEIFGKVVSPELISPELISSEQLTGSSGFDQVTDLFNLTKGELTELITNRFGGKAFRAKQIYRWLFRQRVLDPDQMSDVALELRNWLKDPAYIYLPKPLVLQREASRDGSIKYLIQVSSIGSYRDPVAVEAVLIKQSGLKTEDVSGSKVRYTLCVSSQVGCGMGCKFCRTATMGFKRNLSVSEILQQVIAVANDAKATLPEAELTNDPIFTNMVFMGMGEPLHNVKNVVRAVEVITDQDGIGLAPKRITVSTVGLVPGIKYFGENCSANLAVSLNATTNQVREQIMPVNKGYRLEELIATLKSYPLPPRRSITIEYVMLAGVNDTQEDLVRLPKLLFGIDCKINLIPYNENAGLGYKAPEKPWVLKWHSFLTERGLQTNIRWSKGLDIAAACGQLATKSGKKEPLAATYGNFRG